ncbi:MAG: TolC family protein [Moraxellaceae bacterium]|nr:TolC family protein [Moraxellaceae bacterium]
MLRSFFSTCLWTATLLLSSQTHANSAIDCPDLKTEGQVTLAQVIDRVLCANTDTRAAWQRVQTQQAQVGVARSSYYPSVSINAGVARSGEQIGQGENTRQHNISSNWLLWDFGGRRAGLEQAKLTLSALQQNADLRSQERAISAVQAFFQQLASQDNLTAAKASAEAADETAKAAQRRFSLGSATKEDVLQAQTAAAQALLLVIQRQGELSSVQGQLATLAAYPASMALTLQPYAQEQVQNELPNIEALTQFAINTRPDRLAQQARLAANESELDRLASQSLPSISVSASQGSRLDDFGQRDSGQIALTASMPLFTGFSLTNQRRAVRSQIDEQGIELDRIEQQIQLDVWLAWQRLNTAIARIQATQALLQAATESNRAARARYDAGLGNLLNVLNAQSNLADAMQQQAQSTYDLAAARLQLAQVSGLLVRDEYPLLPSFAIEEIQP